MRLVSRHSAFVVAACLFAPLWASPAGAVPQPIGDVELVRVWAYGTPVEQSRRDLLVEGAVFGNEVVETVRDGALHLRFADDTAFRLGSNSRAVLDKFVYDTDKGTGEIVLSLSKGLFRYISGKLKGESITIRTPTATIGIRGSAMTIYVAPDGATFVSAIEGEAWMTSLHDRSIVLVKPDGANGTVPRGGSAAPHSGDVGPADSGIEPGKGFEANSSVDTDNTGEGEGGPASAGQTPKGVSTAAVFGGDGGDMLGTELTNGVLAGGDPGGGDFAALLGAMPIPKPQPCPECIDATTTAPTPTPIVETVETTLTFDSGSGFPKSFSEAGMTVTSLQAHLHFSGGGLLNHSSCCSTPYEFTLDSGGAFDLVSFDQVSGGASDTWTASLGATFSPTGTGIQVLPGGFTDITSVLWATPSGGDSVIDNLVFATDAPVVASTP